MREFFSVVEYNEQKARAEEAGPVVLRTRPAQLARLSELLQLAEQQARHLVADDRSQLGARIWLVSELAAVRNRIEQLRREVA